MLGKLLKNEFIHTGRNFIWLLGGGIVIGGVGVLFTMTQEIGMGQFLIASLWNFVLIIGAILLEILGLVIILVGTNRALFTERGYLTFALPVSTMQMLFAKFITNVVFMLLSLGEAVGLMLAASFNFRRLFSKVGDEVLTQMGGAEMKDMLGDMLGLPSFGEVIRFAGCLLAVFLVLLLLVMMVALFVFTISHVRPFQAKPSLWIPIFFLGMAIVCEQIITRISALAKVNVTIDLGEMLGGEVPVNMTIAAVMLGLTVGLFFLTNWFLSRKISLK